MAQTPVAGEDLRRLIHSEGLMFWKERPLVKDNCSTHGGKWV
jgi:hypothetical protein